MLISVNTSAAQLYRYKDDQGNYVLNQTIPPKYVKKGYDILNSQGRVIRTVAPALTPDQIAARDAALEQERLRKEAAAKQAIIDNELKQLYSHPNDAVRVLSRRVADIHSHIQAKQSRIETAKKNIIDQESAAADRQRQGLKILETTLKRLEKLKSDIAINEHDISESYNELEKVKEEFHEKIKRLEEITGRQASDYAQFLAEQTSKGSAAETEAKPTEIQNNEEQ
jgi:hypothetical protein